MNTLLEAFKARTGMKPGSAADRVIEKLRAEGFVIEHLEVKGDYIECMFVGDDEYVSVTLPKR